jgi:EAL and modified HD-GYP domain-containing signal transduction protein
MLEWRTAADTLRTRYPPAKPRVPIKQHWIIRDAFVPLGGMTPTSETPLPSTAMAVYLARQPIFDTKDHRVAYELLYRDSLSATTAEPSVGTDMYKETAITALIAIGLDRLTGGAPAWINVTRAHFVAGLYRVFDPKVVVVELLETIEADDEVIAACVQARADGYTLALDDYDARPELEPLLAYVSIVKLIVLNRCEAELTPIVHALRSRGLTVVAECVETVEQRAMCQRVGCTLFQGYVFSRPETFAGRAMSVEQVAIMNILGMLMNERVGDAKLEDAFQSNPTLAHALLRIVNSASVGMRSVTSIPHAMRIVGRGAMSQWLQVMLAATVASRSPLAHEAIEQALVRARFCELITIASGTGDAAAQFMVGLLSRLDVVMGVSMQQVLERLPVSNDVRDALLAGTGRHATILRLAVAYEGAEWSSVSTHATLQAGKARALMHAYAEATHWAGERLRTTRAA